MIEKILKEINRLKNELDGYSASEALDYIEAYINTLQKEPASEDLEEAAQEYSFNIPTQLEADSVWKRETEQHFKNGAEWQKQQMKEALQTEYEKGRFDMQQEMMKDAIDAIFIQDYAYKTPILYGNLKDKMNIVSGQSIKLCQIKEVQQ